MTSPAPSAPRRGVVIAGASGLIGSALTASLHRDGIPVTRLVRRDPAPAADGVTEVPWLRAGDDEAALDRALAGADAVVCLNGASIGRLPWTRRYRAVLRASRLGPTGAIAAAVRRLGAHAPHFVAASAVGFYGHRPGARLDETSGAGGTFLADLCAAWEAAALTAGPDADVALLRTAPLLHPRGVLRPLMTLTRLGVAGPLGSGAQVWPWISLPDEVAAIRHVLAHRLTGPVNLTGPAPATADDVGRELARAMRRPFWLPAPAWALRAGLGADAAQSLILTDADVRPDRLAESGFAFAHPTVRAAVQAALAPGA